jgi:shikimate dehydrogenase
MRLFGLIGDPIKQSFSQKFFTEKFEREGLTDHRYDLFPLKSIDELPALLASEPDLCGLNVTIPYKQAVLPFLHENHLPEGLAACNCIRIRDGRLTGFNTDYIGFRDSLVPMLEPHHREALVLGNGGATKAVTFVLRALNIPYRIVSRVLHDDSTLTYADLDEAIMRSVQIIINASPVGMHPNDLDCPAIPYQYVDNTYILFDLIYNPALTMFLKEGEKRGAKVKNGKEMLERQAEENWRIWNSE